MKTNTLSRRVRSPEDIRIGDFIVITHTRYELLPDNLDAKVGGGEIELLKATAIPYNAGDPMKVVSLSLPFVMTESYDDTRSVIDTRRHVLAKVSKGYAQAAKDKSQRKKDKKKKKRKRKGKGKKKKKK